MSVNITQLAGTCILYAGAEVQTPNTPFIHLKKGKFYPLESVGVEFNRRCY